MSATFGESNLSTIITFTASGPFEKRPLLPAPAGFAQSARRAEAEEPVRRIERLHLDTRRPARPELPDLAARERRARIVERTPQAVGQRRHGPDRLADPGQPSFAIGPSLAFIAQNIAQTDGQPQVIEMDGERRALGQAVQAYEATLQRTEVLFGPVLGFSASL